MVPGQAGGPRKKAARARAQQRPSSPRDLLVSWHRVHGSPCLGALVVAGGALVVAGMPHGPGQQPAHGA